MSLWKRLAEKKLRFTITSLSLALIGNLALISYKFSRALDVLEILYLIAILIIIIHWWWGSFFFLYNFGVNSDKRKLLHFMSIVMILLGTSSVVFHRVYFIWSLLLMINYIFAAKLLTHISSSYSKMMKSYTKKKVYLDVGVALLLLLGAVLDILNRVIVHTSFWRTFALSATFIVVIAAHVWILSSRFYSFKTHTIAEN